MTEKLTYHVSNNKIGYIIKIIHELNNNNVTHKVIYELYDGNETKITVDKNEYLNHIQKISKEVLLRTMILKSLLQKEGYKIMVWRDSIYVIKELNHNTHKGKRKKELKLIGRVGDMKEMDSGFIEERNGDKIIVGYWEKMFLKNIVEIEEVKDENEAKIVLEEAYKILK